MEGLCECGCGQATPLCKYTQRKRGYIKGRPLRFIRGHQGHLLKWTDERKEAARRRMLAYVPSEATRKKLSATLKARGIRPSREAQAKSNANQRGANNPHYKGGVTIYPNGYRLIRIPEHPRAYSNGFVYEHILVAERALGRPLVRGEVVHHNDGDKLNNDPSNLTIFKNQSAHMRHHSNQ
jgi:hypothetical protein